MAGGWGCPHEVDDHCTKVNNLPCNPGMKGCELSGRFRFANEDKNARFYEKQARKETVAQSATEIATEIATDKPEENTP